MIIKNFTEARKILNFYVPADGLINRPYSLEAMFKLMDYLGNPQDNLKIVHVAGTSGKTSTAYYAAALLTKNGSKVGLSVSPHITEVNERLQINLIPLEEQAYCRELGEFIELIKESGIKPSYFELLIAFAYWEFFKLKVDYAVIEVGLGGLLDGTNVVRRSDKVCIITDIGLDHTKVLGDNLVDIARQKAGIIQDANVVFAYLQSPEVDGVIRSASEKKHAHLVALNPLKEVPTNNFLPIFQRRNFGLANAAVDYVIQRDGLKALDANLVSQAAHILIPARMEMFKRNEKVIIIDGAHNAQKINALVTAIKDRYPILEVAALVSFVSGGEERLESSMQELSFLTKDIIITTFGGDQDTPKHSIDPEEIVKAAQGLNLKLKIVTEPVAALAELEKQPAPVLLVTGSFFLLNHIRPLMLKS